MKTNSRFERLLTAIERGSEAEVYLLLAQEPSLAVTNVPGTGTPLHHAAAGRESITFLLLRFGAQPDAQNDLGESPIDLARLMNHQRLAHALAK